MLVHLMSEYEKLHLRPFLMCVVCAYYTERKQERDSFIMHFKIRILI